MNNTHYLAVANSFNGVLYNIKSVIYRFNPLTSLFEPHQHVDTSGAQDWDFFTINNTAYLAVANFENGSTYNIKSNIYRFVAATNASTSNTTSTPQLVLHQQLDTNGARDCCAFSINSTSYLAVANWHNMSGYNTKSNIYRFNTTTSLFVLFQQIDTNGAFDWEFFTINNVNFLAVANHYSGTSYSIKSAIYRFDTSLSQFVLYNIIGTTGARGWSFFSIANKNYLAVANNFDGVFKNVTSTIYTAPVVCVLLGQGGGGV